MSVLRSVSAEGLSFACWRRCRMKASIGFRTSFVSLMVFGTCGRITGRKDQCSCDWPYSCASGVRHNRQIAASDFTHTRIYCSLCRGNAKTSLKQGELFCLCLVDTHRMIGFLHETHTFVRFFSCCVGLAGSQTQYNLHYGR